MSDRPTLIAVTSDQHVGSTLGLAAPQGTRITDGQKVLPSKVQNWTWSKWCDFHARVAQRREDLKAKLIYVLNGDCVEGQHHGTTEIMAADANAAQDYLGKAVFEKVTDLQADRLLMVRGTQAHVGPSGSAEEALAQRLKCEQDPETKNFSSYILRFREHGVLFDFRHHASVGGLPWTRPGGLARLAFRHWVECLEHDEEPAQIIVRSHKHQFGDSGNAHRTRAVITPAWQLKTAWAHQAVTEAISDIGGLLFTVRPDVPPQLDPILYNVALPKVRSL